MQECFKKIKEQIEENGCELIEATVTDTMLPVSVAIEIVNQVAGEYVHNKEKEMYEAGYTKALDDAIEKFLEYGCFLIEWNPKSSKENLVTDVLRQVKRQAVYNLEKMKQKEIEIVNQVSEEYNSESVNGV